MSYITTSQLRDRYTQAGVDEFDALSDVELAQCIDAASTEIDSIRPPGTLGVAATAVVQGHCYTLARQYAHKDDALDALHPVTRDADASRVWLWALAQFIVHLPGDDPTEDPTWTNATIDKANTFTPTLFGKLPSADMRLY